MGKRQSKDRVVAEKIIELTSKTPLFMKQKSLSFFPDAPTNAKIIDSFEELDAGSTCFAEEVVPPEIMKKADTVIVFGWNRDYPSLMSDRVSLNGFTRKSTTNFVGYSHDNITLEVYTR